MQLIGVLTITTYICPYRYITATRLYNQHIKFQNDPPKRSGVIIRTRNLYGGGGHGMRLNPCIPILRTGIQLNGYYGIYMGIVIMIIIIIYFVYSALQR